jgi:hypothetical protein
MQNSNKRAVRSGSGTQRRGIAYTLAGVAAVGAVWLGVSSGTGAEDTAPVAGTQTPTAQQTSGSQLSDAPAAAPETSSGAGSPATPTGPAPAAEPTSDGGVSAESTESATPGQETTSATPVEEPEAVTAVQRFVETTTALNAISADTAATSELGTLADGAALEELKVQGDEMAVNRWTLDGEAEVDGVKILNEPSSTEILQVQACIDSSGVALKDENGALIQPKEPSGTRRSLNLYDLEVRDGAWTVVNHYFPDNADC